MAGGTVTPAAGITTVVFDIGQVILGWDPTRAFTELLSPDQTAEWMDRVRFTKWNRKQDAGRTWASAEQKLIKRFPDDAELVRAYRTNFDRTLTGYVPGTGALVAELDRAGVALLALTNWSAETFPLARDRFGLLDRFRGIVVSGEEGLTKPEPEIFTLLCERYLVDPARTLFVDDTLANCGAAESVGMTAVHFTDAASLRGELARVGLLPAERPAVGPVRHLAVRTDWEEAEQTGHYPWSTRQVSFEQEGFVHLSFEDQLEAVRARHFRDLRDEDLVVVELPTEGLDVVVEEVPEVGDFPHLFRELTPDLAVSVRPWR